MWEKARELTKHINITSYGSLMVDIFVPLSPIRKKLTFTLVGGSPWITASFFPWGSSANAMTGSEPGKHGRSHPPTHPHPHTQITAIDVEYYSTEHLTPLFPPSSPTPPPLKQNTHTYG